MARKWKLWTSPLWEKRKEDFKVSNVTHGLLGKSETWHFPQLYLLSLHGNDIDDGYPKLRKTNRTKKMQFIDFSLSIKSELLYSGENWSTEAPVRHPQMTSFIVIIMECVHSALFSLTSSDESLPALIVSPSNFWNNRFSVQCRLKPGPKSKVVLCLGPLLRG